MLMLLQQIHGLGNPSNNGKIVYTCKVFKKENQNVQQGTVESSQNPNENGDFDIKDLTPKQTYTIQIDATDLAGNTGKITRRCNN